MPRQCEHWLAMTGGNGLGCNGSPAESPPTLSFRGAKRRGNPRLSSRSPGTAVEGEAAAVARGSGSEAVAVSCGGTVLLTDNGTRERRLREEMRNKFTAGRGALRESKTVGFGGVLSHLSFAIERKVTAGGKRKKGCRACGSGEDGLPRQPAGWLGMTVLWQSEGRGNGLPHQ